ncbi:mechanosensitive ion channel family protein [Terrisporobacter sp.]|uniref:mechanosensitive ion channel family protein n=1 Tax=Terrisporobacter sp. TaxID=1965305 RepID=UPI00261162B7|nr:mechanosensitive ion channel family protein [Terrisporobacter sp.]
MFISKLIHSIVIIIIACISLKIIQFALKNIFKITKFDERYEDTLCSVLCSVSYYIIFGLSLILILREFNIVDATEFGSLVTGASIVGIVAGVASQSILKDVFNGFFILFEKQIQVGDFIVINNEYKGVVEEIGIRSTSLRNWDLKRITVPNGIINSIENYSKDIMRVVVHVRVSYEEDPLKVIDALEEVCLIMNEKFEDYLNHNRSKKSGFKVYGITDIEKISIVAKYTITWVVKSDIYFNALREAKLQILIVFRKNNIKIGYPTNINILSNESNIQDYK